MFAINCSLFHCRFGLESNAISSVMHFLIIQIDSLNLQLPIKIHIFANKSNLNKQNIIINIIWTSVRNYQAQSSQSVNKESKEGHSINLLLLLLPQIYLTQKHQRKIVQVLKLSVHIWLYISITFIQSWRFCKTTHRFSGIPMIFPLLLTQIW